jgi:hypothetical protein
MTASRCRCPGRSAQARSSDVFPLPAGAEMIVTFFAAAIQRREKITPVDQPESRLSHQASVRTVNDRAKSRF